MEQESMNKLCILSKNFEKSQLAGRMLPAQRHIDFSTCCDQRCGIFSIRALLSSLVVS